MHTYIHTYNYIVLLYSGGVKVIFIGSDLDVVQTILIIDIMNFTTNSTILTMPFYIVSDYVHTYIYTYSTVRCT